jgi:hypothetical protein
MRTQLWMIGGISAPQSRVLHCAWSLRAVLTARSNPAPPRRQRSCCTESAWHELHQSKSGAEEISVHLYASFMWHTHPFARTAHRTKWLHVHAAPLHAALRVSSCEPVVEVSICCAQQKLTLFPDPARPTGRQQQIDSKNPFGGSCHS